MINYAVFNLLLIIRAISFSFKLMDIFSYHISNTVNGCYSIYIIELLSIIIDGASQIATMKKSGQLGPLES